MKPYFVEQLQDLIEQTITIYTYSYNDNHKLSGVLIGVYQDYITLVLKIGEIKTIPQQKRQFINFNRAIQAASTEQVLIPGVLVDIPIESITSVLHYAL
ncbi:MAG: hypothetical protein ACLFMO_05205 [Eubacteriales bacterium]